MEMPRHWYGSVSQLSKLFLSMFYDGQMLALLALLLLSLISVGTVM